MSRQAGNVVGSGWEQFQVTYANGDTEVFREAVTVDYGLNGAVLLVRNDNFDWALIATLPVAALRKWEWVKVDRP